MDSTFWADRKGDDEGDWGDGRTFLDSYKASFVHPHRRLILDALREFTFRSVLEVGCCNAPNLALIRAEFPHAWLYGQDINKEAIDDAKASLQADFKVCALPKIDAEDKSKDIVIADACLMYVEDIDAALKEMKRVAKQAVIIFDWYTEDEQKINHSFTRDWKKRLQDQGFNEIEIRPLTPFTWPSSNWQLYGRFIVAKT